MHRFLLFAVALLAGIHVNAQTISGFETQPNSSLPDTFYINYSNPGHDVGFQDGLAYFPCYYDTGFGAAYWTEGFAWSDKHDSTTPGFMNQYAAKAFTGYNGTNHYCVAYGAYTNIKLAGAAMHKPVNGMYVTNNTYAYESMRTGDAFAKKFGGPTGNDADWFKLTVFGYNSGAIKTDSVVFYLADYRSANNANDYIVKDWRWVDLTPLGIVDSLSFVLSSSDNGTFGMNTPAYFCLDNLTTNETAGIANTGIAAAKVYPNPAKDYVYVESLDQNINTIVLMDVTGKIISRTEVAEKTTAINTAGLTPGMYILSIESKDQKAVARFQKQ